MFRGCRKAGATGIIFHHQNASLSTEVLMVNILVFENMVYLQQSDNC